MEVTIDFTKEEMMYFLTHNGYRIFFHNYIQYNGQRDKEGWLTTVYFAQQTIEVSNNKKVLDFFVGGYRDLDYLSAISHEFELSNVFKKVYKSKLLNL